MILVLGFVVALIYGLFYFLKRSQGSVSRDSGVIDVVATQSLPGNGMVHLVKVGTQLFMLGSSEQSLRLLTEIDDKESRDEVELRAAQAATDERPTFSDLMGSMATNLGWGNGRRNGTDAGDRPAAAESARGEQGGRAPAEAADVEVRTQGGTPADGSDPPDGEAARPARTASAPTARGPSEDTVAHGTDGAVENGSVTTAEARAEQEVLEYISSQRQRLRRLNS